MGTMPRNEQRRTPTTSLSTVRQPAATRVGFGPRLGNATLSTGEGSTLGLAPGPHSRFRHGLRNALSQQ
jgi:hypothetical protein